MLLARTMIAETGSTTVTKPQDVLRYLALGESHAEYTVAQQYAQIRADGSWRQYRTEDGRKPKSFRDYLKLVCAELRGGAGNAISEGRLEELVLNYEYLSQLGYSLDQMARLGYEAGRSVRERFANDPDGGRQEVERIFAEFETVGRRYLPNDRTRSIQPVLHTKRRRDGLVQLLGITLVIDGTPYRNVWDEKAVRWLAKRLRAYHDLTDEGDA